MLERYKYPIFVLVAGALLAGVGVLLLRQPEPTTITILPPQPTVVPSATPTPGPYTVYVTGAVASPESIVLLDHGSRVLHALEAAGGALENADLARINLAEIIEDGHHVEVPTANAPREQPVAEVVIITATPGTITVHVTGEVHQPDSLVALPSGSRVENAIAAAGGPTTNADLTALNLSQMLDDGGYVYVPPLDGESIETPTPIHAPVVHINYASQEELETLPGIGPALAERIIAYRDENGLFLSIDDLQNVSGIGPAKLDGMREMVAVD